jgi:hypothetical protein
LFKIKAIMFFMDMGAKTKQVKINLARKAKVRRKE